MTNKDSRVLRLLEPQGEPDIIECDGRLYVPDKECEFIPEEFETRWDEMLGTEAYVSHMQACVFEYIWRWRYKNGIEDIKKARECIDNMIRAIEGDGK